MANNYEVVEEVARLGTEISRNPTNRNRFDIRNKKSVTFLIKFHNLFMNLFTLKFDQKCSFGANVN